MGYTTENRCRTPNVCVPDTGQFLDSTCIRTCTFRMERSKHYSFIQKGSRNKSVNYRPVSLTSVICKLLEAIIRDHYDGRSHQT